MARTVFSVALNTSTLDRIRAQIPIRAKQATDDTATAIELRAAQLAPRDTGSLSASIYQNNGTESDYTQHTATAKSLNRDVVILEEIRPDLVISLGGGGTGYSVVVGVAAEHGAPVEFGTRYMSAQSYLTPAVEPERDNFEERMKHVADA